MAAQTVLPRWRGFNLLELFSREGPEDRRSGAFREDDFRWIAGWGFDFVRIPLDYRLWTEGEDIYRVRECPGPLSNHDRLGQRRRCRRAARLGRGDAQHRRVCSALSVRSAPIGFVGRCRRRLVGIVAGVRRALGARLWTRPPALAHATGTGTDVLRPRAQLLAESALLRQQLIVLRRGVKRPDVKRTDRALLVLLAGRVRAWRQALLVVQPATLLRRHRAGFRALWRRKSRPGPGRPPLPAETVDLIRRMADENPLWGAERIRGELAKLGLRVAKRTIQAYLRGSRAPRPRGQSWATFLRAHATGSWACDFLPVTDALVRPLYAFFVVELATRRVVHVGATRHPTDAWVAQQLREATPFDQRPTYLIRDNDAKFGAAFARVAAASGIEVRRASYRAPRANAVCERFLGSVRRECLDHLLILGERHLVRVLREYVTYFNGDRPHRGLGQATPEPLPGGQDHHEGRVHAVPVLGGLHHTYRRAA